MPLNVRLPGTGRQSAHGKAMEAKVLSSVDFVLGYVGGLVGISNCCLKVSNFTVQSLSGIVALVTSRTIAAS